PVDQARPPPSGDGATLPANIQAPWDARASPRHCGTALNRLSWVSDRALFAKPPDNIAEAHITSFGRENRQVTAIKFWR
ncbi:hypothetical protein, partial [Thiolapillus sp.]|uniref:hypothetical protein n=1 Tax=Thiolapillus sp. TaxID=2017437 RepID=UPI003AF4C38B